MSRQIAVGDPVEKVYSLFGTPRIEFPSNGFFIQRYEHCTVRSCDGRVEGVVYKKEPDTAEVVEDKPEAVTVASVKAKAEEGDSESQFLLAYWFQSGQHVPQNQKDAIQWYSRAALQGHVAAQHNLGVIYMKGDGVKKDREQAYVWALLASSNGNDTLQQALSGSLTKEQKLAATIRVDQIRFNMLNAEKTGGNIATRSTSSDQHVSNP